MNLGARIGDLNIDIIINADDIMLISPTKRGIIEMLITTYKYMEFWKIQINLDKTQ